MNPTDVTKLLEDIDGGVFLQKLATILSTVGAAVVDNQKPGSVTIKLDFKHIGESAQLATTQKLTYVQPTFHGKKSEEDATAGVIHVTADGLSLLPDTQTELEGMDTRQRRSNA